MKPGQLLVSLFDYNCIMLVIEVEAEMIKVLVNGAIRITCTVPRHPDNRWLSIGVPGMSSSTRQLDGESAAITHTMTVTHLECGVTEVVCDVEDNLERHYQAQTSITVAGCE